MNIKLVKLTSQYKMHSFDMMDEWISSGESIMPSAIAINDYHDFDYYMNHLCRDKEINGIVPETTYFCIDLDRDIFVGAVTVRHYLTPRLLNSGLIGDGIRPRERGKGYGSAMIGLALEKARSYGLNKVLMCCDKRNIASAKSIMNNGGILENEVEVHGIIKQRYWIDNTQIAIRNSMNVLKKIVNDTFPLNLKDNTLDFLSYLDTHSMKAERISGYWKNQFYWEVTYKNKCVCYILLNGTGDEKQFAPLTIWSDDSGSDWYKNDLLSDEFKEIAWKNVDYCVHCGSCSGGTPKTIFGREFDNICKTTMRFTNPDMQTFNLIKELINARKNDIEV